MSYELKSSIKRNKFGWPLKVVSGIIFILVILHFVAPNFLTSIFAIIVRPLWNINAESKTSLNQLSDNSKDIIISQLTKENNELKELMGRSISKKIVIGYILKKPPFTAYDSYILDIGTKDGITQGDQVYLNGNVLVGEVQDVFLNTSRVKLYSSYGEKYDILIGDKNVQATAIGRGGGSFETVIPRDVKVAEGDIITIPNITNTVFGTVGKIIADPARAFSTVIFSQPINIYEQKFIQVYIK